jgi:hypothetical protein
VTTLCVGTPRPTLRVDRGCDDENTRYVTQSVKPSVPTQSVGTRTKPVADKLFTILCETCGCRLQVRDAAVIGQILHCPKCQSMVLVAPPPGWSPTTAASETKSPAATAAKNPRWTEAASPRAAGLIPAVSLAPSPRAAGLIPAVTPGQPATAESALLDPALNPAPAPQTKIDAPSTVPVPEPAPVSLSAWISPTEKLARQWIGLTTGICVGILIGAGLLWLALGTSDAPSAPDSAAESFNRDPQRSAPPAPAKPSVPAPTSKPNPTESTKQPPPTSTAKPDAPQKLLPPPPNPQPPSPQPPPPADVVAKDPPSTDPPAATPAPDEEPLPTRPPRPALPPIEVEAQLAVSISRLNVEKAPLVRVLDLLSSLSTIPITLDASAIEDAQIRPETPITVRLSNPTIRAALDQAVAAAKLTYIVGPDHILVTPPQHLADEWIVVRTALGDLAGGEPKRRAEVANLVTAMVAPQSWKTARPEPSDAEINVDGDDLVIRQTRRTHHQIEKFLARLRTARGVAGGDGDLSLLRTRRQQIDPALSRRITLNYTVGAPLSKIVAALVEETKLTILVDWRALRAAGIGGQTSARMTAANEPIETALTSLLTPLDLTYRILDSRTLHITTPSAAAESMHVEFYPLGDLAQASPAVDKLVRDFRRDWQQKRGEPAGEFHFDAASRCLILRHTQAAHNDFERRLATTRSSK